MNALRCCPRGSLWRNTDGVVVEVHGLEFWVQGRRSGENVHTGPVEHEALGRPWERYFNRGPSPVTRHHRQIPADTFINTHTRLGRDEEAWERDRPVQLELPLRETRVPYVTFLSG